MVHAPLVACALALSACSNSQPTLNYSVTVDPGFTSEQIDAIVAGLGDWQSSLPTLQIATSVESCGGPMPGRICVTPAHDPPNPSDDIIGATSPGSSNDAVVLIYVDRIQATGWDTHSLTQQTAAHEMGHAMGLKHSSAGELMAPNVPDQAHSVTSADVSQFWAVRGM